MLVEQAFKVNLIYEKHGLKSVEEVITVDNIKQYIKKGINDSMKNVLIKDVKLIESK